LSAEKSLYRNETKRYFKSTKRNDSFFGNEINIFKKQNGTKRKKKSFLTRGSDHIPSDQLYDTYDIT
jgi:hypothetical protein